MSQKRFFNILLRDWIGGAITLLLVLLMGAILFSSDDMKRPKIPKPAPSAVAK